MRHYCTLFNIAYVNKGLALHRSLMEHSTEPFTFHILAMDVETLEILDSLSLPNVSVIAISTFEHALELRPVRYSRSTLEYFWTLASVLMQFCLSLPDCNEITYCDADVFFFSNPKAIFDEMGDRSIGIVPHRFHERDKARLLPNGIYNVGIVVIRNTESGQKCVAQWASDCMTWCYLKHEDGKFADQKYLDHFERDYGAEVCVIENLGVNLGPWSIGNFNVHSKDGSVFINDDQLVAYHYHELRDERHLTNWPLRMVDHILIYAPYLAALREAAAAVSKCQKVSA
jgi:hypothetical protein